MASARELVVKFIGDTSSLSRSTKQAENDLNSFQSGIRSKFQGFDPMGDVGKSFGTAIAGYASVTIAAGAAYQFLKSSAQAAMEDTREQTILAQTLRDTVGATNEQIAANEKWITSTQNATGVVDSQIRDALVPLLASTHDVASAHDLLSTAMDISTARGLDLTTVSVALAKAHDGNIGALGRLGIQYKDTEGNVLSFDQVVQNANETFGGATAAAADTAAGKMAILSAKFKDLQEQIGNELLPAFASWADFMSNTTVPAIGGVISQLDNLKSKAGGFLTWALGWEANLPKIFGGGGGGGGGISGFSGGGGGGAAGATGNTGLGSTGLVGSRGTGGPIRTDVTLGVPGSSTNGVMDVINAQKAFFEGLSNAPTGGGGGGGGGGKSLLEKKKEADDKAIAETLKSWANYRDNMREIEDDMYKNDTLSFDQYKAILEKRLDGAVKGSDEWTAIQKKLNDTTKAYQDKNVKDAEDEARRLKQISDQKIKDAQDAANHMQEIQDNMFEVGAISTGDYIAILQARLGQFEQFSNEWTRIYEEIQRLGGSSGGFGSSGSHVGGFTGDQFQSPAAQQGTVINIATVTVPDPRGLVDVLQQIDRTYGGVPINVRTPA